MLLGDKGGGSACKRLVWLDVLDGCVNGNPLSSHFAYSGSFLFVKNYRKISLKFVIDACECM